MVNDLSDLGFIPDNTIRTKNSINTNTLDDLGFVPDEDQSPEEPIPTAIRYAAQPFKALLVRMLGLPGLAAEVLSTPSFDEEEIEILEKRFPNRDIRKELEDASLRAKSGVPIPSNIFQWAEELGIPTEARTEGQKAFEVASLAYGGKHQGVVKGIGKKIAAEVTPTAMKLGKAGMGVSLYEGLRHKGLPHEAALMIALGSTEAGEGILESGKAAPTPSIKSQGGRQITALPPGTPPGGGPGGGIGPYGEGGPPGGPTPPPVLAATQMLPGTTQEVGQAGKFQLRTPGEQPLPIAPGFQQQEPSFDVFEQVQQKLERQREITAVERTATKIKEAEFGKPGELKQKTEAKKLTGKGAPFIEKGGKDVGYRPIDESMHPVAKKLQSIFTKNDWESTTDAGFAEKQLIRKNYDTVREKVNNAYEISKPLLRNKYRIDTETPNEIQSIIHELEDLGPAKRTPIQEKLLAYAKDIQKDLVGFPNAPIEVNAQKLVDQIQNIHTIINEYEPGKASNIFYPLKNALEKAVERQVAGDAVATKAWVNARGLSQGLHEVFDNEHVSPFLIPSNQNFDYLAKSSSTIDSFNPIQRAMRLVGSEEGAEISQIAKARLVKKVMDKYVKNPKLYRTSEFEEDINSLRRQLTPEELSDVRKQFVEEGRTKIPKKVTKGKWIDVPVGLEQPMELPTRYKGYTPEKLAKETDTISGLRTLKYELDKVEGGPELFEEIKKQKAMNFMYEGEEPNDATLFKTLGNSEKKRYLQETLGKEKVSELEEYRKKVLQQRMNKEKYTSRKKQYEEAIKREEQKINEIEKELAREKREEARSAKKQDLESAKKRKRALVVKKEIAHEALSYVPMPHFLKQMVVDAYVE